MIDKQFLNSMCSMTGYSPLTTFWEDFSIADAFGKDAIIDTYDRAFKEWKSNYKYITELCMILNWKCWEHHEKNRMELSELYSDLFYKLKDWCYDNLKGEELNYFFEVTD